MSWAATPALGAWPHTSDQGRSSRCPGLPWGRSEAHSKRLRRATFRDLLWSHCIASLARASSGTRKHALGARVNRSHTTTCKVGGVRCRDVDPFREEPALQHRRCRPLSTHREIPQSHRG